MKQRISVPIDRLTVKQKDLLLKFLEDNYFPFEEITIKKRGDKNDMER